jgi:DNA-binding response OmpR family regulator
MKGVLGRMSKRKKILVIDDDELWLSTIEDILGNEHELTLIAEHSKADELLEKQHFDLLILDKRLSDTSGLDVLSRLRKTIPNLRAIMLTGYPDVDSAVHSMKIGALDYISKGAKDLPSELQVRVREALESHEDGVYTDDITALIRRGESAELEFKASARWDIHSNRLNKELEKVIIKTVAAFLNSATGGTLLIGVNDSGVVVGLDHDYQSLGKRKDRDGYENFLTSLLLDSYGKESSPFIRISFHQVDGNEVCRIDMKPSPKPVFVCDERGEHFFLRAGNSTRLLSTREAIEYCKIHWG